MFVHHVFFWLKEDLNAEEIGRFETGVKKLLKIEHVQFGDVGNPAATNRPVIERSYTYSLLLVFANLGAHELYQPHPVHKKFIADCSQLWSRVLVYDSETVN